ncbi:Uu.00g113530.m01.CDS01 [Anthostomella pinea]|uniref:Uu.00g113530.m01.CDS01 n=1 Tax=Anthostomella pinea TaxID=933095 RepID=A0AAI8YGJ5_9PEZI|nr:Uu.00g113530.m01.CDS01 [Anthostomella pinea]
MNASSDDSLTAYARQLVRRLGGDRAAILELIDRLEASNDVLEITAPPLQFERLLDVLIDPMQPYPAYIEASESALSIYTEDEMDIIVIFIQARFWITQVLGHLSNRHFRHWINVFMIPRQILRETWYSLRRASIAPLVTGALPTWAKTFPPAGADMLWARADFAYLRKQYFPDDVDDAFPGFLKHYKELRAAVRNLKGTLSQLYAQCMTPGSSRGMFLDHYFDRVKEAEALMDLNLKQARKWFKTTANTMKLARLPGANFGLEYGTHVFVDWLEEMHFERAPGHWAFADREFSPIQTLPGSPWCRWFRNRLQPSFALIRYDRVNTNGETPHFFTQGPVEIQVPHAVLPIIKYFKDIYNRETAAQRAAGEAPAPKSGADMERENKELSRSTGEPYWHIRKYADKDGYVELEYSQNPALALRPMYDGAGNLRLDYMNAMLHDLVHGGVPFDFRKDFGLMVLTAAN